MLAVFVTPSIEIDDAWKPVKDFIEHHMGVNTEREQVYFDKWDEGPCATSSSSRRRSPEPRRSWASRSSTRS